MCICVYAHSLLICFLQTLANVDTSEFELGMSGLLQEMEGFRRLPMLSLPQESSRVVAEGLRLSYRLGCSILIWEVHGNISAAFDVLFGFVFMLLGGFWSAQRRQP